MVFERDKLLESLRENVIDVTTDGSTTIRCTLRTDLLPPSYINEAHEEAKFHEENKEWIAAWGLTTRQWQSININSVKFAQVIDAY